MLLKVVESGGFTKAGHEIGLTQSGVSHNITALESELGVTLLNRGRGGTSLTTAGEYIIPHIRNIVANMAHMEQKVAAIKGMELGKISVGSFPSFTSAFIPALFSICKERFPSVEIVLYEGGYGDITKWVEEGTVDLGFTALPVKGLECIPLLEDPLSAVVYDGHPFIDQDAVTMTDFLEEPFIMLRSGCEVLIEDECRKVDLSLRVSYNSKDNETVLSMVKGKLGVSIMPNLAVPRQTNNIHILPLHPPVVRQLGLIMKPLEKMTPLAQEFGKIVTDYFKNHEK
ncbi:LysR family transcriptional regulator [Bacillus sp. Au-Bac7]|uniref:LysR family transcriptional regulator n=1 Tax=Bacillus sp. Au-Bac7 TaxID=2906458 RepID=UPI001E4A1993|nr:LysR family transcriptional regulator [Bacillus sp. Au-Bac7]MCE4052193.1 LysR family transcriptional regulator [Bacillus sp. Au-Bac7]